MDLHAVTSNDEELEQEQQQGDGRRYRARMYSDVVLLDLDWDEEPASQAGEGAAPLKIRSA